MDDDLTRRLDPATVGGSTVDALDNLIRETAMLELEVAGMTCGHCVRAVAQAVRTVDPKAEVQVDLGSKRVRVEGQGSADELVRALGAAGYPAILAGDAAPASAERRGCCGCR